MLDLLRDERETAKRAAEDEAVRLSRVAPDWKSFGSAGHRIEQALEKAVESAAPTRVQESECVTEMCSDLFAQAREILEKRRQELDANRDEAKSDTAALRVSKRVADQQPRADYTINQLQLHQPQPVDTVAFWSNQYQQTYQCLVSALQGSNVSGLVVNVKDYGALGDNVADDTASINEAIVVVQDLPNGGCLFFPAGIYLVSSTLIITDGTNFTVAGSGINSNVTMNKDIDIFRVTGGKTGMAWMNINLTYPAGIKTVVSKLGSAINIQTSITDTFFLHVFTNGVGLGLTFFAGGGRNVAYGCKFLGDYVGVYLFGHGIKLIGDTINGGTYGLVCDGGGDPKIFECPFFGCLSILSMNSTGSYKGGTFYIFDGEGNFGPPPSTMTVPAFGVVTLVSGAPITGNTHFIQVHAYSVPCPETTGISLGSQAINDAAAVNAFFTNPANFPAKPDDLGLVSAAPSGNTVILTAVGESGVGGNNLQYVATSSASIVMSPLVKTHFIGGADNGLWPGDAGDTIGALANSTGLTVGCGGYLIGGDHAQCNIIVNWVKDGIVFGDQTITRNAPQFVDIIGGNIGASNKGKSQISNYALDFQNVGQVKVIGVAISPGADNPGSMIHIPPATFIGGGKAGAILISNCYFKVTDGTWCITGDDNTAYATIVNNDMVLLPGAAFGGAGWAIQITGQNTAPPFGTGGNWIARGNRGFNPFGWLDTPTVATGAQVLTNTYGIAADYYVTAGGGGTISEIDIYKNDDTTTVNTNLLAGTFHLEPGAMLRITSATAGPRVVVNGD